MCGNLDQQENPVLDQPAKKPAKAKKVKKPVKKPVKAKKAKKPVKKLVKKPAKVVKKVKKPV